MCALAGKGVALLKDVMGASFEVSEAQAKSRVTLFLLLDNPELELSAIFLALCLPACCHASGHENNKLNL